MGLKKTNYKIESLGITLPQAYAIIKDITINGESARADFVVQASRETANTLNPLEIKTLYFKVDRNTNPYQTAYIESKKQVEETRLNVATKQHEKVLVDGIFTGWNDDFSV